MDHSKSDFTQGSILKKLSLFMIPVLGALILQAAYGAVDLLVVGRFGTTAGLSAVSTGSQVLNLITFVVTQFAMGITVLIARYIGEKKMNSKKLNENGYVDYKQELPNTMKEVREVWQLLKQYLQKQA